MASSTPFPLTFLEAKIIVLKLSGVFRENGIPFHPPLQGEGRGPKGRGVGCSAMQGVAARCARSHPNPPRFARRPPLQGKVIEPCLMRAVL